MKLYTEEQVREMLDKMNVIYSLEDLTPIELPTYDEIYKESHNHFLKGQLLIEPASDTEYAFKKGAKWVIDKIKNRNNMTNRNDPINSIVQTSISSYGGERMECTDGGLTKREYFAAMAMQVIKAPNEYVGKQETEMSYELWGKRCVKLADLLINALNEQK